MSFVEEATAKIMEKRPQEPAAEKASIIQQALSDLIVILQKDNALLQAFDQYFAD